MPSQPVSRGTPLAIGAQQASSSAEARRRLEEILGETIPPLILQAQEAFLRDLPQLLRQHYREWVAYRGDQCLGIGPSKTPLYQECLRRGLKPDEFVVLSIEPEVTHEAEVPLDV